MKLFRQLFRRGTDDESKQANPDFLDVHDAKTLEALPLSAARSHSPTDDGAAVREFYLHHVEVQSRYPLGLLPIGQKRFAKWLVRQGRAQHDFSDAQILAFLQATATDLPRHLALTYQINPDWQQRFPQVTDSGRELLVWLREQFPQYETLGSVADLPLAVSPRVDTLSGVNFLSHFCYPSGLQQAALGYTASLRAVGLQTSCRDVPAGIQTELEPREEWLGIEQFPVTITNVAPTPHFASRYARAGLAPRPGVLNIAYWAWELEAIPDEWIELGAGVDEIWTPTPFVSAAMRAKMPMPVYDMLPGLSIGEVESVPRARLGIADDEFVFLFMFDMRSDFERKNPLGVVRAFREAFRSDDRATLVIKLSRGSSDERNLQRLKGAAAGAKIVFVDEVVSRAQAYGYIAMGDCVVSLHRSEGFGMLMAEAMLLGKPVIATNYSGNTAFMDESNSLLVDYSMVEVSADGPIYKRGNYWAEASTEHAATYMRRLFEERDEALALGSRGQRQATEKFPLQAAGERMKARLEALWQERGRA